MRGSRNPLASRSMSVSQAPALHSRLLLMEQETLAIPSRIYHSLSLASVR